MKVTRAATAALALMLLCAAALAAGIPLKAGIFSGPTVGVADSTVVPANSISQFLYLENVSATATICIAFGVTATITGTACSAGEITLQPGATRFFDVAVPTDAVHAIASGASTPLTIGAQ